jgi:hypothetical protein
VVAADGLLLGANADEIDNALRGPLSVFGWGERVSYMHRRTNFGVMDRANPAHSPWRRLSAQANEADIRVVPEPGMLLVLVAEFVLLSVLNISCIRKSNT